MNQKLSNWASIAEIVSGIAVVLTLIFLILGIRENTEVLRVSAYSDVIEKLNDVNNEMFSNPDAIRVWSALLTGETDAFDDEDDSRIGLILASLFRSFESAYHSWNSGLIGDDEWTRFDRSLCNIFVLAQRDPDQDRIPNVLTDDFEEYMREHCIG